MGQSPSPKLIVIDPITYLNSLTGQQAFCNTLPHWQPATGSTSITKTLFTKQITYIIMQTTQQESVSDLTRKGACLAFFTAYDDLDTARMIGLAAPDATVHFLPLGEGGLGTFWEFGKAVWDSLIDCFPDINNTVDSFSAEGDIVTANVTICGTQAKDFLGISNKGFRFNSDHIFIFHFNDADRIKTLTINWDAASFARQLGA